MHSQPMVLLYGVASLLVISLYWVVQYIAPLQTAATVFNLLIFACHCCSQQVTVPIVALL